MTLADKLDRLESITKTQQENGTEHLRLAGISYDDGTVKGVMDHIPKAGGGGAMAGGMCFVTIPPINEAKAGGIPV